MSITYENRIQKPSPISDYLIETRMLFMKNVLTTCDLIRQTSYEIHRFLQHGFLEKIYQNALINRLTKLGLIVQTNQYFPVYDQDGTILGEYYPDLLIGKEIIIELKACRTLTPEHVGQLFGYLKASRLEHGLLINFGAPKLEIRKYVLSENFQKPR